jgi:hypothetical protein
MSSQVAILVLGVVGAFLQTILRKKLKGLGDGMVVLNGGVIIFVELC